MLSLEFQHNGARYVAEFIVPRSSNLKVRGEVVLDSLRAYQLDGSLFRGEIYDIDAVNAAYDALADEGV